ncbi:hypothetical protein AX17_003309 [Amanita inopinata Kibby_2008]|nr:hypothetical protein AX17_003309 [Amanita inopinata Kibby_2008]
MMFLRILRYVVFALFVICNAIIASVAVWNQGIDPGSRMTFYIDIYLILLGTSGLLLIFTLLFLELAGRASLTRTTYFECVWITISFVTHLAGAVALTVVPKRSCILSLKSEEACSSSQVLLAFTWITTIILFVYLIILVVPALLASKETATCVRFPWLTTKRVLPSEPPSPVLPQFVSTRKPTILAPVPRRVAPITDALYPYCCRSGLGPQYETEHCQPTSIPILSLAQPVTVLSSNVPQGARRVDLKTLANPSLYPQFMQSIVQSFEHQSSAMSAHAEPISSAGSPPPPLGDWPRPDILKVPIRSKRLKYVVVPLARTSHGPVEPRLVSPNDRLHPYGPRSLRDV